jgi:hypothetical protein
VFFRRAVQPHQRGVADGFSDAVVNARLGIYDSNLIGFIFRFPWFR